MSKGKDVRQARLYMEPLVNQRQVDPCIALVCFRPFSSLSSESWEGGKNVNKELADLWRPVLWYLSNRLQHEKPEASIPHGAANHHRALEDTAMRKLG